MEILGLIELPMKIELGQARQAARLPATCAELNIGEWAVAVGNGRTQMNSRPADYLLRHGYAEILPRSVCLSIAALQQIDDLDWVICTMPRDNRSTYSGDSGEKLEKRRFRSKSFYQRPSNSNIY